MHAIAYTLITHKILFVVDDEYTHTRCHFFSLPASSYKERGSEKARAIHLTNSIFDSIISIYGAWQNATGVSKTDAKAVQLRW